MYYNKLNKTFKSKASCFYATSFHQIKNIPDVLHIILDIFGLFGNFGISTVLHFKTHFGVSERYLTAQDEFVSNDVARMQFEYMKREMYINN